MIRLLIFFLAATAGFGQPFGFGVKGAVHLTSQVEGDGADESPLYLVGPMIEVRLPRGFGVEVDALYSRFGYSSSACFLGCSSSRARGNTWQVPMLVKYRLHGPWLRPYVVAGYVPLHSSGAVANSGIQINPYTGAQLAYSSSYPLGETTDHGIAAGGGVEFGAGRIHVAPEVRFIRWKDPLYSFQGSRGYYLAVPQNEVQLLVGLTWSPRTVR